MNIYSWKTFKSRIYMAVLLMAKSVFTILLFKMLSVLHPEDRRTSGSNMAISFSCTHSYKQAYGPDPDSVGALQQTKKALYH